MTRIGRPRKAEALQKQNISVNIRKTLLSQLNTQLSYNSSRSVWIEDAIKQKLDKDDDENRAYLKPINEISSIRLVAELRNRQVVSPGLFETLEKVIIAGDIE